jgi:hypothetical protein
MMECLLATELEVVKELKIPVLTVFYTEVNCGLDKVKRFAHVALVRSKTINCAPNSCAL